VTSVEDPEIGSNISGVGPLAGLHILDVTTYVAGPSGMMTLAQLGADVVRIDPIKGATDTRRLPLDRNGTSLYWAGLNKAKRSIKLNLSSPEGQGLVRSMLSVPGPGYGVIVTNAVADSWLGYEALRECRDDLIHVHILGHPNGKPAVDYTVNSEVGIPWLTGPPEYVRPVNHVLPAWDLLAGLHAAIAVLTADRLRRETGRGQGVRLALSDVAVASMGHLGFIGDAVINGSNRLRDGNYLYGSFGCDFPTSDGRRVMVVALTSRHWRNLVALTGTGKPLSALEAVMGIDLNDEEVRYENRGVVTAVLTPWFESRSHAEIVAALDEGQVLWGNYRTVEELVHDPTSLLGTSPIMSNVLQEGVGTYPVPGPVLQMESEPVGPTVGAPVLGADTQCPTAVAWPQQFGPVRSCCPQHHR
jgi:2-methylfumaryl-CoA isomerase